MRKKQKKTHRSLRWNITCIGRLIQTFDLFINIQSNKNTHLKWHRSPNQFQNKRNDIMWGDIIYEANLFIQNFCTQLRIYLAHSYICRLPIRFFADKFSWVHENHHLSVLCISLRMETSGGTRLSHHFVL